MYLDDSHYDRDVEGSTRYYGIMSYRYHRLGSTMNSESVFLVMRKRYDESYSKPVAASKDKLTALATCLNLTKSRDIFEFSLLEVPVLDDIVSGVENE